MRSYGGGSAPRALMVVLLLAGIVALGPQGTTPAAAGPTGGPASDPSVHFDAGKNRWVSMSSGVTLTSPSTQLCSSNSVVEGRGYINVPVRTGPRPNKLGSCWDEAFLDPPANWWAVLEAGGMQSPSVLFRNGVYWLTYSARKVGTQQRCIGLAASDSATGPAWFHLKNAQQVPIPLHCPSSGASVGHPELYRNQDGEVYLLWSETVGTATPACATLIKAQHVNMTTGTLDGAETTLLDPRQQILGFDEVSAAGCSPGGVRHVVENPTMIRADNGTLWLLFSANDRTSNNYATGWALCGTGAPGAQACDILNGYDPVQPARHRPVWGAANRTAPGAGSAKPYFAFPDLSGFGGLSIGYTDPATPSGVVYATGQYLVGGVAKQVTYRLDTRETSPALFEPEIVTFHGAANTFGSAETTPPNGTTPSGHDVTTRPVSSFGPAPGYEGIFNAMAADGTVFVSEGDQNRGFPTPTADGVAVGSYDPRSSTWTNIPIKWNRLDNKTTTGTETLPAVDPANYVPELPWEAASRPDSPALWDTRQVGASLGDVEDIQNGTAIAFTIPAGNPFAYGWLRHAGIPLPAGADGVWPSFGILTNVNGKWQVASGSGWVNQWTGGQLRTSAPASNVDEQACPPTTAWTFGAPITLPADESWCRFPNELVELPGSKDIIVADYGGGITALRITNMGGGRYNTEVRGFYEMAPFPTPDTTDDPSRMVYTAAKTVDVDPTGQPGDERFILEMDVFESDAAGNVSGGYATSPAIEFSYNSTTGAITPSSAPMVTRHTDPRYPGQNREVIGGLVGLYDTDGNFWGQSGWVGSIPGQEGLGAIRVTGLLGVYGKTPARKFATTGCGYVPGQAPKDYWITDPDTGKRIWGAVCQPDYEIVQAREIASRWGGVFMFTEDPATRTMVSHEYWFGGALAIRHTNTPTGITFEVGNSVDTGEYRLAPGIKENRPGVFDATGRYWFTAPLPNAQRKYGPDPQPSPPRATCEYIFPNPLAGLCPGTFDPYQPQSHWMVSIDVPQLFAAAPVVLPTATGSANAARVQAEDSATTTATVGAPVNGMAPVNATARTAKTTGSGWGHPGEDHNGTGFQLLGAASGTVEYKVWVPVAGNYQLGYRVHGPDDKTADGGDVDGDSDGDGHDDCTCGGIQVSVAGSSATYPTTQVLNWVARSPETATKTGPTVNFATPGLHTIRLTPTAGSTWLLNWFTLTRV
jgi:hypothetical protein